MRKCQRISYTGELLIPLPGYDSGTDRVMRFVVGNSTSDNSGNDPIPSTLRTMPPIPLANVTKNFEFARVNEKWVVNGVGWADISHRFLTRPTLGAGEIWELRNGNGAGVHPVHMHLVDFRILSRSRGRGELLPYEAVGLKDVVWLAPNETVRVVARYAPWPGV